MQTVGHSSRALSDHLPAKRQKTDHSGNYTPLGFAPPLEDRDNASQARLSKSKRPGSQSVTSAEEKTYEHGVDEYRAVEGIHDPNRRIRDKHRARPPRARLLQLDSSIETNDPIQDLSDESFTDLGLSGHPPLPRGEVHAASRAKPHPFTDSADLAILGTGNKVSKSPGKQDFAHTLNRTKKRLQHSDVNDEVDELAGDSDYIPPRKLNSGQRPHEPAQSSSISTRGDLKPSLAAVRKLAPLEDDPLPLDALIWAPSHIYEASGPSTEEDQPESLVLRSHEDNPSRATLTLHPAVSSGQDRPQYGWFQIHSWKIDRVRTNYNKYLVKVTVPSSLDANLGRTLYLRFHSREDTEKFIRWIRRYSNSNAEPDPKDALEKEFLKQSEEVKKRPSPKAKPGAWAHVDTEASRPSTRRGAVVPAAQSGNRLIDVLGSSSAAGSGTYGYTLSDDDPPEQSRPRRTVRTRRGPSSPEPVPSLDRWTEVHADWDKNWRLPLSFHRTSVEKDDISRLDEGQCLNDNIIGFYLKYLQIQAEKQQPSTSKRIYFHNSFFYSKLKPTTGRHINYDGVKNWTAKVDLFSYDYIVVPVNEHFHWWVAIICNPGKLDSTVVQDAADGPESGDEVEEVSATTLSGNGAAHAPPQDGGDVVVQERRDVTASDDKDGASKPDDPFNLPDSANEHNAKATVSAKVDEPAVALDGDANPTTAKTAPQKGRKRGRKSIGGAQRKYNPADPRIITLDSLGASHSPVCSHLKQYLIAEFKDKKGKEIEYSQPSIGMRATNIPEQNNFCDCGVYLLKYVSEFLDNPDKFIQGILLREHREWDFDASRMRNDIRQLIFDLHGPYQQEQEEAKRQRALAKRKREPSKSEGPVDGSGSSTPNASVERAVSPRKVVGSAALSRRTSPVAGRDASPPATVSETTAPNGTEYPKVPPNEQQTGSSGPAQYDRRTFHVVDNQASQTAAAKAALPQSVQTPARPSRHSQPSPSIEIADDDDLPAEPTQQSPSPSTQASLSVGAGSVQESDDKVVEIRRPPQVKDMQKHRQDRSSSQTAMSAQDSYRKAQTQPADDGKAKESTKLASPVEEAPAPAFPPPPVVRGGPGLKSGNSPYFGMGYTPGDQAKVKKTYKTARRTPNGGTIDLTDE